MIAEYFPVLGELNLLSIAVRLMLAVLFGGIIGFERGRKRQPAGMRTHMLVCLGSALAMLTNQYLYLLYHATDPARLGAQVISGIGFLGAGTIILTYQHQVRGLSTAAGLWCSACLGLAVGIGFYDGALIACLLLIFIVAVMRRLDNRVVHKSRVMEIYVEMEKTVPFSTLLAYMQNHGIQVSDIEFVRPQDVQMASSAVLITVKLLKKTDHVDVLDALRQVEGVVYINEV